MPFIMCGKYSSRNKNLLDPKNINQKKNYLEVGSKCLLSIQRSNKINVWNCRCLVSQYVYVSGWSSGSHASEPVYSAVYHHITVCSNEPQRAIIAIADSLYVRSMYERERPQVNEVGVTEYLPVQCPVYRILRLVL